MNKIEISVIIPTFKPKEYIRECFESLDEQTLSKSLFEVIIVLNGETQPYLSFIQKTLSNVCFNYELIVSDKKGVSNARNIGLEKSKGDYIVFIDDDDKISPNYIKNLYESVNVNPNSIVVSNVLTFNEDGDIGEDYISKAYKDSKNKDGKNLFEMRKFLSSACCKIIPKEIIGVKRFNPAFKIGEDSLFMSSLSENINKIILSSEDTIYFRRLRIGSASRSNKKFFEDICNRFRLIREYCRIYFSNIRNCNLMFILSRIVAVIIK